MKLSAPSERVSGQQDETPGLPWLQSWGGVYLFVLGTFIFWVVLLHLLTRKFS